MKHIIPAIILFLTLLGCSQSPEGGIAGDFPSSLSIVTRNNWGWQPFTDNIPEHEISFITIHHGGVVFSSEKDPREYMRTFQEWCRTEKHWIDNPYHYMIDLAGVVYEARPLQYPGDTNTAYDPTGHALICVLGNYEEQSLSPEQLTTLVRLTAYLSTAYSVPRDRIKTHRDYTETLCPGKNIYAYFENGEFYRLLDTVLTVSP
ncbi:MAG: N-acetylmuramoyl-L-alanine amidase [Fidelibacterota bacterium]